MAKARKESGKIKNFRARAICTNSETEPEKQGIDWEGTRNSSAE